MIAILPLLLSGGRAILKVLGAIFTFFTTKPGIYVLLVLLVAGAGWRINDMAYDRGAADAQHKEQMLDAKARQQAIAGALVKQKQMDAGLIAAADHAGYLRGKAQAQTIYITKEITKYVTRETDQLFPVPCGLVRLHDAAALGSDPAALANPSGLADGEACPIKASDLAGIIVWNYGLYHEAEAQIAGLQDLARTLATTISDGKPIVRKTAQ